MCSVGQLLVYSLFFSLVHTVEYALELANKPMGVSTYSYAELPIEIALSLPNEEQLSRIFSDAER
jgi:hypothetical protein